MKIVTVPRTDIIAQDDEFNFDEDVLLVGLSDGKIVHLSPYKGRVDIIKTSPVIMSNQSSNTEKPITDYVVGEITHERVSTSNSSGMPDPGYGVLTTYRFIDDAFSYQEWKKATSVKKHIRNWNPNTSSWGAWSL